MTTNHSHKEDNLNLYKNSNNYKNTIKTALKKYLNFKMKFISRVKPSIICSIKFNIIPIINVI